MGHFRRRFSFGLVLTLANTALRGAERIWHLGVEPTQLPEPVSPTSGGFECPKICRSCCRMVVRHFRFRAGTPQMKCIIDANAHYDAAELPGRKCTKPVRRSTNPEQFKVECSLKEEEVSTGAYKMLRKCSYEGPHIRTYDEFLGPSSCSSSTAGKSTFSTLGRAVDALFFSIDHPITGGVCGTKAKMFKKNGLMDGICKRRKQDLVLEHGDHNLWQRFSLCAKAVKGDLCKMLQHDFKAKRLDKFSMGIWAGAIHPLKNLTGFPKPSSHPRQLKKFQIPGWRARAVAYESLPGDVQINLNGRGMVDITGKAFLCLMRKMQGLPVTDDFSETENNYISMDHRPAPGERTFWPRKSTDILWDYIDKFQLYEKPLHFDVESTELQTDRTLVKLVFQAIGGHRLEAVSQSGEMKPLTPIRTSGAAVADKSALLALNPVAQKAVRFALRMEGLLDDVPLREGMGRWGGNAFFDSKGQLVALQYSGQTLVAPKFGGAMHPSWNAVKFAFRSSLVSTITVYDHLVSTHILASESLAVATAETLPKDHALRVLLTPHTYGSLDVNFKAANNLFAGNMLLHRASPFTQEAFQPQDGSDGRLWKKVAGLRYNPFQETFEIYRTFRAGLLKEANWNADEVPEVPYFEDGKLLHDMIGRYVSRVVSELYGAKDQYECGMRLSKDLGVTSFVRRFFELNDPATKDFWPQIFRLADTSCPVLVAMLTELIFLVSGFHRHVGTVSDFFRDTSFAAMAWKHGETEARPKHTLMVQTLAATTNAILPKLTWNISGLFVDHAKLVHVSQQFRADMLEVQGQVERRNQERRAKGNLEFHQMEPMYVDWGVFT